MRENAREQEGPRNGYVRKELWMLYAIDGNTLTEQKVMQFSALQLKERNDLQRFRPPSSA